MTCKEIKEIAALLNDFLATLDSRECAIFVARYYYSYSIAELAKHYVLSKRQVKYRLAKTRKELRAYLVNKGVCL